MESEALLAEPLHAPTQPVAARGRRAHAPPGFFRRSLALSLLIHSALLTGAAVVGFERALRPAEESLTEISVVRAAAFQALEDPVEPAWEADRSDAGADAELPELVTAQLPETDEPPALDALDEELEATELEVGDVELPLESWARPQAPPVAAVAGGAASAGGDAGEGTQPPSFVPRRLRGGGETGGVGMGGGTGTGGGEAGPAGSRGDAEPVVIEAPEPKYPPVALRRGWEGSLVARIRVGVDGLVESVSVEESSGYEVLDGAALDAIRMWRFEPGRREGKKRALEILHRVRFRLVDARGRAGAER